MIRNRSKAWNQTLIRTHQQLDPTANNVVPNNYLPELPPPPYVPRKPARISTPAAAVDPPELPRPHHHRSFLNQRFSEYPNNNNLSLSIYQRAPKVSFLGFHKIIVSETPTKRRCNFFFSHPSLDFQFNHWNTPKKNPIFFSLFLSPESSIFLFSL